MDEIRRSYTPNARKRTIPVYLFIIPIILVFSFGFTYIDDGMAKSGMQSYEQPYSSQEISQSDTVFMAALYKDGPLQPRPLGQVTIKSSPTTCDTDQECFSITVKCNQVFSEIAADIKIGNPTITNHVATAIFFSGGLGTGFWAVSNPQTDGIEPDGESVDIVIDDQILAPGITNREIIISNLRSAGYRTIQVDWGATWFWAAKNHPEGNENLSCRPATIIRWIYDQYHHQDKSKPYCAVGHSNGAAEVAYPLVEYGLSSILSAAIFESGPNWSRLDDFCIQNPQAPELFGSSQARSNQDNAYGYYAPPPGPCSNSEVAWRDRFYNSGVIAPGWAYDYPQTNLAFIFGSVDTSTARYQGELFYQRIIELNSSNTSFEEVAGADHYVTGDPVGMTVVENRIKAACVIP